MVVNEWCFNGFRDPAYASEGWAMGETSLQGSLCGGEDSPRYSAWHAGGFGDVEVHTQTYSVGKAGYSGNSTMGGHDASTGGGIGRFHEMGPDRHFHIGRCLHTGLT